MSADDKAAYTKVRDRFEQHFMAKRNTIFERAKFNQRTQGESEPVDAFITDLYVLAESCGYAGLHDEMIRDRIVVGLRDIKLSEKLQMDSKLTLKKAVDQARQSEAVKKQQTLLRSNFQQQASADEDAVYAHKKQQDRKRDSAKTSNPQRYGKPRYQSRKQENRPNQSQNSNQKSQEESGGRCGRCGKSPRHPREKCPAKDARCNRCQRMGHWSAVCRANVSSVDASAEDDQLLLLGEVTSSTVQSIEDQNGHEPWMIKLQLEGTEVTFKIDTGADVTVVSESVFKKCKMTSLEIADKILHGPGQSVLKVKGQFMGQIRAPNRDTQQKIYVVEDLKTSLLGRPAIEALGIVAKVADVTDNSYKHQFPQLFSGLGRFEGEYTIELDSNSTPFSLSVPRRVPIPLLPAVKTELQRMEELGVITRVDQPTDWCAGMVVARKPNGSVRLCVDLTKLNRSVRREKHPLPTVEHTLGQISKAKVFSKLDANSGFWQIPLAVESRLYTTFITPFGRFCFNRLPFGISSAPEYFQKRMSRILEGLDGVVCQMDDILVYGNNKDEHDRRLNAVFQRIADAGITLNHTKCVFGKSKVTFLGQVIGEDGIQPDPGKVQAVKEMLPPASITELRRFLGMVNQLGKFLPNLAEETKPLRDLLSKENHWIWEESQEVAFQRIKGLLTTTSVLAHYDAQRSTLVSADASSYGLGAVLMQEKDKGEWQPVAYASRSMTSTEQRYAQVEKEALATTWACERFNDFLLGKEFHIETDHKPLVPLLGGDKNLSDLPLRIQRFRMRLMRYQYTISHVPGKNLITADTLSRAPVSKATTGDLQFEEETSAFVEAVMQGLPASGPMLQRIATAQQDDRECNTLIDYTANGWPKKNKLPKNLQMYFPMSGEFTVQGGLLMRGNRLVIPKILQTDILGQVHAGHQGLQKCFARASQTVWWPGMRKHLEDTVNKCHICLEHRVNNAEPLKPTLPTERPWQKVASDLFDWKQTPYLLVVDYFSRYPEVVKLSSTSSKAVIQHLKTIFARHGIPEIVMSDNGPQYSSEDFKVFARDYDFVHQTSSPHFPQSNGAVERCVQTIKRQLNKSTDPQLALMEYRSTAMFHGYSPAQLLMGRQIRTTLPRHPSHLTPQWPDLQEIKEKERLYKVQMKKNFDQRHAAKRLSPLKEGDSVWVKQSQKQGTVTREATAPRSYVVQMGTGVLRRNRRHLIPLPPRINVPGPEQVGNAQETLPRRHPERDRRPPSYLKDYVT